MNCEAFKQNIDAYIDGVPGRELKMEMEKHAAGCAECMELLEQAKLLQEMCAELSDVTVPLPAQAAWRRAIRKEAQKKRNPLMAWSKGIAATAAALIVLVTGTYEMRMGDAIPVTSAPVLTLAADDTTNYAKNEEERGETGIAPLGYVLTSTSLQSDGSAGVQRSVETGKGSSAVDTVVLRSAKRSVESASYDSDIQWLNDLVSEYEAYFEGRSETAASSDGMTGRVSTAIVRVPSDRLDNFLMELDQLGTTVLRSETADDVTGRYMDTQSRLDALKMQKAKLDEMLENTASVEELIAIDDKMAEVIGKMESLEGDLRRWDSQRSYSRVELTLTEKVKAPVQTDAPLGARMKQGFDESVQWMQGFGQDALVMLAAVAPKLILWIPAVALIAAVIGIIRAKRRG